MTTQELILQLVSYDVLKPVMPFIILAILIDTYFRKNKIYRSLKNLAIKTYSASRKFKKWAATELKEHYKDVTPPSAKTQLIISWFLVFVETLITSWMLLYALCVTALLVLNLPSTGKFLLGMAFVTCLFFFASFYRAGAYKLAKQSQLNLSPWKKTGSAS